jgi:hypothetical protein
MVEIAKKSDLQDCLDDSSSIESEALIRDLVNVGGVSTNAPELENLAGISRVRQIADSVEKVTTHLLTTLTNQWEQEKHSRDTDNTELLADIKTDNTKLLADIKAFFQPLTTRQQPVPDIKLKLWIYSLASGCTGGIIVLLLSWLVLFPAQLRSARGTDALALERLSTSDGELLRRSIKSKNFSVQQCAAAAKAKNIKQKGSIPCLVYLK